MRKTTVVAVALAGVTTGVLATVALGIYAYSQVARYLQVEQPSGTPLRWRRGARMRSERRPGRRSPQPPVRTALTWWMPARLLASSRRATWIWMRYCAIRARITVSGAMRLCTPRMATSNLSFLAPLIRAGLFAKLISIYSVTLASWGLRAIIII